MKAVISERFSDLLLLYSNTEKGSKAQRLFFYRPKYSYKEEKEFHLRRSIFFARKGNEKLSRKLEEILHKKYYEVFSVESNYSNLEELKKDILNGKISNFIRREVELYAEVH